MCKKRTEFSVEFLLYSRLKLTSLQCFDTMGQSYVWHLIPGNYTITTCHKSPFDRKAAVLLKIL